MSFTIIDRFKPQSAIYTRKAIPTFRTTYEEDKYYDQKKQLWIEGNGDLTGMHIYYLDEIYLFNRVTGETYYPICRDIDVIIFHEIERLRKINRWLYITKGRGLGLSTIAFSIPHWFFRIFPGSKCVATTGKDKSTLGHLFSNYFMHGYNHLDENIKPKFLNKNETKAESYLRIQLKVRKENDEIELRQSEFICKETSDTPKSPTAFSGYGAIYGVFDEVPLHPRRADLLKSASEIFVNPLTKEVEGFLLAGGTIEDTLTTNDIIEIKKFIETCGALNFESMFIPATYGRCMTNGWSDLKKAEEQILRKREELDLMDDKSFLKAYIKNNPLTLEEIWDMGGNGKFEDDVIKKVQHTIKVLNKEQIAQPCYDLVDINGKIISSKVNKSPIVILEPPKEGIAYKAGNDGTGSTKHSGVIEGSEVALVITKMFDPSDEDSSYTPVAYYAERPATFEQSYIKQTNLLKLYNEFGLLKLRLQANQANEHFGAYLINQGLQKILGFRHDLGGLEKENTNKMGTYVTDDIIEWQYRQANKVLRRYGHNFKLLRLLQEILLPYATNTDVLDAWLMCLIEMGISFDKIVEKKKITPRVTYINKLKPDGTFERVTQSVAPNNPIGVES